MDVEADATSHRDKRQRRENNTVAFDIDEDDEDVPDEGIAVEGALDM